MKTRITRWLVIGLGWVGLLLAFMPFYTSTKPPPPAGEPTPMEFTFPTGFGDIPLETYEKSFTVGLPFSPWFRYVEDVETTWTDLTSVGGSARVATADGQPAPPGTVKSFATHGKISWKLRILNWSALLAMASISLLIATRWHRRRSQGVI